MANASNFLLIICCFVFGMGLKRLKVMPADAHVALNRFIIYISLPALTLELVHKLELGGNALYPVMMPWIFFIVAAFFFKALAKPMKWDVGTLGALILTGGLGNTSFLGYPLIETFYGKDALSVGVLTDQPGSFMVLSTLGIFTASSCAGSNLKASQIFKRILTFPPFQAAVLALLLRPFAYPSMVSQVLDRLGSTLVPLALVSVGMQLSLDRTHLKEQVNELGIGLFYKLILGPALIALLYFKIFGASGREIEISVFQAAMAPMITGGILASENGLNPRLASLMIGIGIPLSLLTVPAWWWLLSHP
ncbi:MAG: AEC family transporter [Bdellovibrionia bacterium]